jgi:hypothetical protein
MTKFNLITPLFVAGAVASAIAAAPIAAADATVAGPAMVSTHFFPADPGGGGCVNGQCGSGGVNGGPGGGPGGTGCVPTANGTVCGSGGLNAGPGGVPGGTGCIPGVGCGSGNG